MFIYGPDAPVKKSHRNEHSTQSSEFVIVILIQVKANMNSFADSSLDNHMLRSYMGLKLRHVSTINRNGRNWMLFERYYSTWSTWLKLLCYDIRTTGGGLGWENTQKTVLENHEYKKGSFNRKRYELTMTINNSSEKPLTTVSQYLLVNCPMRKAINWEL